MIIGNFCMLFQVILAKYTSNLQEKNKFYYTN